MKIAFASCFDGLKDSKQPVWKAVAAKKPDVLLLLGDSIYMDFGFTLKDAQKWSPDQFLDEMYERYEAQWAVDSFRKLVLSVSKIGTTWDDHDFAWNNACGADRRIKEKVSDEKYRISRKLHLQFRIHLSKGLNTPYPKKPKLERLLTDARGIQDDFNVGDVQVIMTDGRTWRQNIKDKNKPRTQEMLGEKQRKWIEKTIKSGPGGPVLLCSGSTLAGSRESWEHYSDLDWLIEKNFAKLLVLSGDIHKNKLRKRTTKALPVQEVTSSGAARPGFIGPLAGSKGKFGILNIAGDRIKITLYDKKGQDGTRTIEF